MEVLKADIKTMFEDRAINSFRFTFLVLLLSFTTSCSDINAVENNEVINERIAKRIERLEDYIHSIDLTLEELEHTTTAERENGEINLPLWLSSDDGPYSHIFRYILAQHIFKDINTPKEELELNIMDRLERRKDAMLTEIQVLEEIRKVGVVDYIDKNMVAVPAGHFDMGSEQGKTEMPVHQVAIKEFYLSKYELTEMLWYLLMGNPVFHSARHDYHDFSVYYCSDCPVTPQNWNTIQLFIQELNQLSNGNYRLPSETEWEYACRSGGKDQQYCGGNDVDSFAWYDKVYNDKNRKFSTSRLHPYPVGSKQPNELELYDMSGNVYEWVQDCWHENYKDLQTDSSYWIETDCEERVVRGGGYEFPKDYTRSTLREYEYASKGAGVYGFRLAKDKEWWDLF